MHRMLVPLVRTLSKTIWGELRLPLLTPPKGRALKGVMWQPSNKTAAVPRLLPSVQQLDLDITHQTSAHNEE